MATATRVRSALKVWVYPEKNYEVLGAERWQASWEEVRPEAKHKVGSDRDIDPDADIEYCYASFSGKDAKEKALKYARKLVDGYNTAYGQVTVTRQVVDWYVEEDRIAEWVDTSEVEYVD